MSVNNEEELRALWRSQATMFLRLSPEELRERARKFDAQARRRHWVDRTTFGLSALIFIAGTWLVGGGPLFKLGCVLMALWSLWGVLGLSRYGSVLPAPADNSVQSCALHYRLQLARQRDIVLSWPLGIALLAPGFFVFCLGMPLGPAHVPWEGAVGLMGIGTFVGVASLIYGRVLAGRWQVEIDGLDSMRVLEPQALELTRGGN
jgi:hypothetical protein